jgi:hypothetical protein
VNYVTVKSNEAVEICSFYMKEVLKRGICLRSALHLWVTIARQCLEESGAVRKETLFLLK